MSELRLQPERIVHPSGLVILHLRTTSAPVVAAQVWVRVGSGDEREHEAGLAHVHEHMLFKGTERRGVGQIAREIEVHGGSINAWTSFDQTVYHVTMPSRAAEHGLDILFDAVQHSRFEEEELARELEVIQEEIRRGEDMPSRVLSRALFAEVFRVHPYGRPVIGTSASVASFRREDVLGFFRRWYHPANMTLVVVGDIDREAVVQAVDARVPAVPRAMEPRPARPAEPPQAGLRSVLRTKDIKDGIVNLAFRGPDLAHPDCAPLELLLAVLGQGEASVLFEKVQRERRLARGLGAMMYALSEPGILAFNGVFSASTPDADPRGLVHAIATEVFRARHRLMPTPSLERVRTIAESEAIYQCQTVQGIANRLGYFEVVAGSLAWEERSLRAIGAASAGDLLDAARTWLHPDSATIAAMLPDALGNETSEDSLRDAVQAAWDEVERSHRSPRRARDDRGIVRHVASNGLRVLVQRDRTVPLAAIRMASLGGMLRETAENNGIAALTAELQTAGTRRHSASELAAELDRLASNLSAFAAQNSAGVEITALSRNVEAMLDLAHDVVFEPTFPDAEFERVRAENLGRIAARHDNLALSAYRRFEEAVYGEHPYARPLLGSDAAVRGFTRDTVVAFHPSLFDPARGVVAVVGDVDPDWVIEALEQRFGRDPVRAAPPAEPPPPPILSAPQRFEGERDRQQAHIVLGFPGCTLHDEDRLALDVLSTILAGQGGRLFLELRDRQSLAYSVSASASSGLFAGAFTFYIATSPAKIDQAIAGMRAEIQAVIDRGVTDDELARAHAMLVGRRHIGMQRAAARASHLLYDELYDFGYDWSFGFESRVRAVDAASVRAAAARFFRPEREIVSIIRPVRREGSPAVADGAAEG